MVLKITILSQIYKKNCKFCLKLCAKFIIYAFENPALGRRKLSISSYQVHAQRIHWRTMSESETELEQLPRDEGRLG